jgi:hypothetical protein
MKTKLLLTKILAAIILIIFSIGSAHSQQVISSVSVNETAKFISKVISEEKEYTELIISKSENWMSNKTYLDASSCLNLYRLQLELKKPVIEKEKQLESWMFDDDCWCLEDYSVIEDWMLDENFWKIKQTDENNSVEPWMIDDDYWVMVN